MKEGLLLLISLLSSGLALFYLAFKFWASDFPPAVVFLGLGFSGLVCFLLVSYRLGGKDLN